MLDLRVHARRGGSLLAVVGCFFLLLADSDEGVCKSTAVNQAYDVTVTCTTPPESVTKYSGRVRFQGDVDNNNTLTGTRESGTLDLFTLTQFGDCSGDGEASTVGSIRVSYVTDESGNVIPSAGNTAGSIPVNGTAVTCDVEPAKVGTAVGCVLSDGKTATNCQATVTAVP